MNFLTAQIDFRSLNHFFNVLISVHKPTQIAINFYASYAILQLITGKTTS